ncbi:PaaI family thioesterase [Pseudoprimorskyibacter insulae]|uniref:Esterase n=1 Tax=Pseudoprimorskyibacter insulae TaxID=1695997 RepID=A0A2R8B0K6_9RHOB|nr:PaaI family thioesterase [Pseudoprimorskyibacter insulae]SPF81747.1 Putative esterase [Pseudoprimorskyibacter insulae]
MTQTPDLDAIARNQPPFARYLGIKVVSATPDEVVAELHVSPDLLNRNGTLHGGAVMAICDNMGGTATFLNLKPGQSTVTVESKTNFLRAIPAGDTITCTSTPLHKGRKTQIWQTTVRRSDGKTAAIVTQTQMVLDDPKF